MFAALLTGSGLRRLLWALVAAAALKFAAYLVYLARNMREFLNAGPLREGYPQFSYAIALWFPGIFAFLSAQGHQYIVSFFYRPEEYAIYAVACFQVPFLGLLTTSIAEVFVVRAAEYWSRQQHSALYELWVNACRKSLMLFLPLAISLAVLSRPLITVLFTPRYQASARLFSVIVLALVLNGLLQDQIFRACGRMRTYSFFHISRGLLGMAMGIVAVKLWGLWGAAWSVVVALTIVNLCQLVPVAHLLRVSFARVLPWKDLGKMAMASVVAATVVHLSVARISIPVLSLVSGLSLFAAVYALMIAKLGLMSLRHVLVLLRETRSDVGRAMPLRAKMN